MENKKKDELQNRREFFKKAAKGALPILGAIVLTSAPILSQAASKPVTDCQGCTGLCTGCTGCTSCSGWCEGQCRGCEGGCTGCTGCSVNCYGKVR